MHTNPVCNWKCCGGRDTSNDAFSWRINVGVTTKQGARGSPVCNTKLRARNLRSSCRNIVFLLETQNYLAPTSNPDPPLPAFSTEGDPNDCWQRVVTVQKVQHYPGKTKQHICKTSAQYRKEEQHPRQASQRKQGPQVVERPHALHLLVFADLHRNSKSDSTRKCAEGPLPRSKFVLRSERRNPARPKSRKDARTRDLSNSHGTPRDRTFKTEVSAAIYR